MDESKAVSLPLLFFATLAAMTAVCGIFNLLHFRSTAQGGYGPSGPMVNKYANERSGLNKRKTGSQIYSDFGPFECSPKRCKIYDVSYY